MSLVCSYTTFKYRVGIGSKEHSLTQAFEILLTIGKLSMFSYLDF